MSGPDVPAPLPRSLVALRIFAECRPLGFWPDAFSFARPVTGQRYRCRRRSSDRPCDGFSDISSRVPSVIRGTVPGHPLAASMSEPGENYRPFCSYDKPLRRRRPRRHWLVRTNNRDKRADGRRATKRATRQHPDPFGTKLDRNYLRRLGRRPLTRSMSAETRRTGPSTMVDKSILRKSTNILILSELDPNRRSNESFRARPGQNALSHQTRTRNRTELTCADRLANQYPFFYYVTGNTLSVARKA